MTLVRSDDIIDFNISYTRISSFKYGMPTLVAQEADGYALGTASSFAQQDSLLIKTVFDQSGFGWQGTDDWSGHNLSFTTIVPFPALVLNSGVSIVQSANISQTVVPGTIVGLYGSATWAAGPSMGTARGGHSGAGSLQALLIVSGQVNVTTATSLTELFNGSSWSSGANVDIPGVASSLIGRQNAAINIKGSTQATHAFPNLGSSNSSLFNGSTWITVGNTTVAKVARSSAGSVNAGIIAGGEPDVAAVNNGTSSTELFNGSVWSSHVNVHRTTSNGASCGGQLAMMIAGSSNAIPLDTGGTNVCLRLNGSAWTTAPNMNAARSAPGGSGTPNNMVVAEGASAITTSEMFNGTTWYFTTSTGVGTYRGSTVNGSAISSIRCGGLSGFFGAQTPASGCVMAEQTLFRSMTYEQIPAASSIGVVEFVNSTTISVKFKGKIYDALMPGWDVNSYLCLSEGAGYNLLDKLNNNIVKMLSSNQMVIGGSTRPGTASNTKTLIVFGNTIRPLDQIKRW